MMLVLHSFLFSDNILPSVQVSQIVVSPLFKNKQLLIGVVQTSLDVDRAKPLLQLSQRIELTELRY